MSSKEVTNRNMLTSSAVFPDGNGSFTPCPELMTESELIQFLRIPEISGSTNYHNVIENLKRVRRLPKGDFGVGGKTNRCWKIVFALWFILMYNDIRIV